MESDSNKRPISNCVRYSSYSNYFNNASLTTVIQIQKNNIYARKHLTVSRSLSTIRSEEIISPKVVNARFEITNITKFDNVSFLIKATIRSKAESINTDVRKILVNAIESVLFNCVMDSEASPERLTLEIDI